MRLAAFLCLAAMVRTWGAAPITDFEARQACNGGGIGSDVAYRPCRGLATAFVAADRLFA